MAYKSYKNACLVAMKLCKKEFCIGVGTLVEAEAKNLVPVETGFLRNSIVSEVMPENEGVVVGVLADAPYGLFVEKGTSKQVAQPYLEPGAINSIPKIANVANKVYKQRMGGK